jgi:hypothetical protein
MNKLVLTLLSSSTTFSSMLLMLLTVNPVQAAELTASSKPSTPEASPALCACSLNPTNIDSTAIPENRLNSSSETPMLDFTEEESETAIQRFGCDCVACVNTIRKMRGLLPVTIR